MWVITGKIKYEGYNGYSQENKCISKGSLFINKILVLADVTGLNVLLKRFYFSSCHNKTLSVLHCVLFTNQQLLIIDWPPRVNSYHDM